jgi:hypothetical protein
MQQEVGPDLVSLEGQLLALQLVQSSVQHLCSQHLFSSVCVHARGRRAKLAAFSTHHRRHDTLQRDRQ